MKNQTKRTANLSMYDWPETENALNHLWYAIQKKLNSSDIEAPRLLDRDTKILSALKHQELLLGQTCGWPYINILSDYCIPFATIHYDIEDCPPGTYNCVYIGQSKKDIHFLKNHEKLLEAGKIAINSDDSQSGFHVFREITKRHSEEAIPKATRYITGSHRASIKAVAEGKARLAAIDTICFELAKKHDPDIVKNISVLGRSIPKPGLPIVTSKRFKGIIPSLLEALAFGIYSLSDADKQTLMIKVLMPANPKDYKVFL